MTPQLRAAADLAASALSRSPAGLFADFDGTLAPIVRDPATARLADGAAEPLRELSRRLAMVAIISGRAAAEVRAITGLSELAVAGNHGIEWLPPGAAAATLPSALATIPAELDRLLAAVPRLSGVRLEDKGLSATVHYRTADDPATARRAILAALSAAMSAGEGRVELREGRMSVELRPAGAGDKGTAVRDLAARHELRGLVVLGDDVTDLDMFRAAEDLRAAGATVAIIGVGGDGEVPPAVAAAADVVLPGPESVVALLRALADGAPGVSSAVERRTGPDRGAAG